MNAYWVSQGNASQKLRRPALPQHVLNSPDMNDCNWVTPFDACTLCHHPEMLPGNYQSWPGGPGGLGEIVLLLSKYGCVTEDVSRQGLHLVRRQHDRQGEEEERTNFSLHGILLKGAGL